MLPFLAGLAGKAVLGAVVKKSIEKAMDKAADNPNVPMSKAELPEVTEAVIDTLQKDPVFINATNSEPFYQSGVAWGSAVAALGTLVPIGAKVLGYDISTDQVIEIAGSVVTLAGIVYTLYRRFWPGLKPIGGKK